MTAVPVRRRATRPHRAPAPEERLVDGARTRAALLDAALEEFSAKGFAGARVRDIAARAGVSKDLIAYHYGGKEGLYLAVQGSWLDRRRDDTELPLAESVAGYLHDAIADPRAMRLFAWRGLAANGETPPDGSGDEHPMDAANLQRRQARGELDGRVDPATLQLVLLGAVAAPVVFPDTVRRLFGVEVTTPEFEQRYRAGLVQLIETLGAPSSVPRPAKTGRPRPAQKGD